MTGSNNNIRVALAQMCCLVGDLTGNVRRLVTTAKAVSANTDLLLTPELCVCGYPPEDLLAYDDFIVACEKAVASTIKQVTDHAGPNFHMTLSFPKQLDGQLYNVVQVVNQGRVVAEHRKIHLPNYGVFDEKRYFAEGTELTTFKLQDCKVALAICHDIWAEDFLDRVKVAAPNLLAVVNASPFYLDMQQQRERITTRLSETGCAVAYVNHVGAQDEHIFDGGSHYAQAGTVVSRLPMFEESTAIVPDGMGVTALPDEISQIAQALTLGVKAYVDAADGRPVFVGVSGGIDSAVVLCVAVAALGSADVIAVLMPTPITASISIEDGMQLANNLGVKPLNLPITDIYTTNVDQLRSVLGREPSSVALENLQSRIRGTMLMALANDAGGLVLTTGNKNEMATGYATLYGDMAGAFDVLKDVSKQRVYALARHWNKGQEIIPARILSRPPTAELREGQLDSDSLPDYAKLDLMLERIVEGLENPKEVARDLGGPDTLRFTELLERNEFKRRQAPIGPTITHRAFGKGWRMPIANRFSFTEFNSDDQSSPS